MKFIKLFVLSSALSLSLSVFVLSGCGDNGAGGGGGGGGGNNNGGGNNTGGSGSYETVTIGGNVWMKKNLNIKTDDSWCYNDSTAYCDKYGRLYTWSAAKNACPSGWKLPDSAAWTMLVNEGWLWNDAGKLKSKSGWDKNGNGTDDYGFSGLPAGFRAVFIDDDDGSAFDDYGGAGGWAKWWTATEYDNARAYSYILIYDSDNVGMGENEKGDGYSVRCIKTK
jgi:uncharacterized protein (TIGR02145 family)